MANTTVLSRGEEKVMDYAEALTRSGHPSVAVVSSETEVSLVSMKGRFPFPIEIGLMIPEHECPEKEM